MEKRNIYFIILVLITFVVDQLTKYYMKTRIGFDQSLDIFSFFRFFVIKNKGAGFGLLQNMTLFLILFSLLVLILIIYYYKKIPHEYTYYTALIAGGTLGNLIDRIFYGYVIDFIDIGMWPTFNVADTAISMGVVLIIIVSLINEKKK